MLQEINNLKFIGKCGNFFAALALSLATISVQGAQAPSTDFFSITYTIDDKNILKILDPSGKVVEEFNAEVSPFGCHQKADSIKKHIEIVLRCENSFSFMVCATADSNHSIVLLAIL